MGSLSDEELERLLDDLESDRVERKARLGGDAANKIREAICAFANDLPDHRAPGVVFIGVDDDGVVLDEPITDELLRNLADMKSDGNIWPMPSMTVGKRTLRGREVSVITVQPADAPPVAYKGRSYIRTGPRRGIASKQDERILNERRRYRELPFDLQPIPSSTIDDLSRRIFEEEYLPQSIAPDVLAANDRTYPERLATMRMICAVDDPTPTLIGHLAIGTRTRDFLPGAYVQFLRIDGLELGDPIVDEAAIDGPLRQLVQTLDGKLRAHIRTAVDLTSGPVEARHPDYPIEALDQLVRNAILHRTYESTHAPVRITWFNDRVEIASPGGPYGQVTAADFGQPGVVDYRNPTLAEAMKALGLVQRFGVGIATARKALARNGSPPLELQVTDRNVLAIVRRPA